MILVLVLSLVALYPGITSGFSDRYAVFNSQLDVKNEKENAVQYFSSVLVAETDNRSIN